LAESANGFRDQTDGRSSFGPRFEINGARLGRVWMRSGEKRPDGWEERENRDDVGWRYCKPNRRVIAI
jgi:hypothetical protein